MVLWGGGGCGVGLRSGWLLSVRGGPLFPLRAGRGVGAGGVGGYSVRPGELLVLLGSVSGRWPMGEVLEVSVMAGLGGLIFRAGLVCLGGRGGARGRGRSGVRGLSLGGRLGCQRRGWL